MAGAGEWQKRRTCDEPAVGRYWQVSASIGGVSAGVGGFEAAVRTAGGRFLTGTPVLEASRLADHRHCRGGPKRGKYRQSSVSR